MPFVEGFFQLEPEPRGSRLARPFPDHADLPAPRRRVHRAANQRQVHDPEHRCRSQELFCASRAQAIAVVRVFRENSPRDRPSSRRSTGPSSQHFPSSTAIFSGEDGSVTLRRQRSRQRARRSGVRDGQARVVASRGLSFRRRRNLSDGALLGGRIQSIDSPGRRLLGPNP